MLKTGCHLLLLVIMLVPCATFGQVPFLCEGQSFMIQEGSGELVSFNAQPGNLTIITPAVGVEIEALGFRSTDRLLYGIGKNDRALYRIDANGTVENLGTLTLDNSQVIIGGEIGPDGRYFAAVGLGAGLQSLSRIDLENPAFPVTTASLPASRRIIDLAFNPLDGRLFGYDELSRSIVTINFDNGSTTAFNPIEAGNEIDGLYFNAFGELLAYGSSIFGVANAIFEINKANGKETRLAAGPPYPATDATACPYGVAVRSIVQPTATFPCSEVRYTFTIGNGSGQIQTGTSFVHELPAGFQLATLARNPFGGTLNTGGPPNQIRIENMSIPRRVDSLALVVEVGDVPGSDYRTQAAVEGLPEGMGGRSPSDNPATLAPNDSTHLLVNRFEEDSVYFSSFLCLGSSLTLDASAYGSNVLWNTGSTNTELSVTQQGVYSLQAFSGCQALSVTYEVTAASCPFTVEVGQKILPAETYPCQEVTFRYIIGNDSGLPRSGIGLSDTLPAGFTVVRLDRNPFGATLDTGLPPGVLRVRNMSLPIGVDSLDVIVAVGNAAPGTYRHRATLSGLPQALGPTRLSFNADTLFMDSTALHVFGVDSDTTYVEEALCPNEPLVLNGSPYGISFLWEDGSTGARLPVTQTGRYQLVVFNGCEPSIVYFDVTAGPLIDADYPRDTLEIHLGEEVLLSPTLANLGSTLLLEWDDPLGQSLSCTDCLAPTAKPLESTRYTFRASNELCADTLFFTFLVDDTRRIFAPNAFSPNQDGRNDYFYLQSPDFGIIRSLSVYDRWGGLVFQSAESALNQPQSGWDGIYKGQPAPEGSYLWRAEIEFIGEIVEGFSGEVSILR